MELLLWLDPSVISQSSCDFQYKKSSNTVLFFSLREEKGKANVWSCPLFWAYVDFWDAPPGRKCYLILREGTKTVYRKIDCSNLWSDENTAVFSCKMKEDSLKEDGK